MESDPRGFIKQWRKEIDSEVWLKPPLYTRFWLWLKMAVDYKTGSMITTYSQMAEAVAWVERGVLKRPNRKTIYEILGWFEGNSMVTVQSNKQYTIITLINWHIYNSNENAKVTQNGQPEVTEDGQEDGHSLRSTKKLQEFKEVIKGVPPITPKPVSANADIQKIETHYKTKILKTARMTDGAKKKITTRLKRFTVDELCTAIDKFNADSWWMENNAHRGLKWFFDSDDRIDQFLNLKERANSDNIKASNNGKHGDTWRTNLIQWNPETDPLLPESEWK